MITYAHRADALEEDPAVDGVAIPNEVLRRFQPRECLGQLPGRPLRCGMSGDVHPNEVAAGDADDNEAIQHPEADGRYDEEIDGSDVGSVVAQEGAPGLRRRLMRRIRARRSRSIRG